MIRSVRSPRWLFPVALLALSTLARGAAAATPSGRSPVISGVASPANALPHALKIHDVQGHAAASSRVGERVALEGVVTGFLHTGSGRDGFYLQEEAADEDGRVETSEGIYVYAPQHAAVATLTVGDVVAVTGTVKEFNELTEIDAPTRIVKRGSARLPPAAELDLPLASVGAWEAYEGMRVSIAEPLTITGTARLGRYGELDLSSDGQLWQATHVVDPNDVRPGGTRASGKSNAAAVVEHQALNRRRSIILDDGNLRPWPAPTPYLSSGDEAGTCRVGDTVTRLTGVLTYRFKAYRIDPQGAVKIERTNPRPAEPPSVGAARLRLANANVLNYFLTLGSAGRGASNAEELARQRAKTVASLLQLRPDVCALMEIERRADNAALRDLVEALNARAGAGTYAFIDSSAVAGTDAIQVALLYRPAAVTPRGKAQTDTSEGASVFHRPPLAQTFVDNRTEQAFTVVVNHFKSKSSRNARGEDRDQGDGQGAYNATRRRQAQQLLAFLAEPRARFGDPDVLVVGDINAYAEEDPVDLFRAAGLTDQLARFQGTKAYSYSFDGEAGYLDHALANASMAAQVTGAAQWHINADEPAILDYNLENKTAEQRRRNEGTPYRSSDHDPVLVGLALGPK